MDNGELIKRFRKQQSDRTTVQEVWDLIEEYVTPYRGRFFRDQRDEGSIEWRDRSVWDSTAITAHQTLAASLHGALTSPSSQWFDIRYRKKKLNDNKRAASWLRDSAEAVYWALQDSNFNTEINETYQDLAGFGTSFISEEESGEELEFSAIPLKEGYFEPTYNGEVGYFYRHLKWTPFQIVSKFPDDTIPQSVMDAYEQGSTSEVDVLFCIYPRHNRKLNLGKVAAPSRRPYGAKYMLLNSEESIGKEKGYYEMPVFAPRWRLTSESIWGNSPAMMAMNDILTLNAWVELMTIAAEKQIDPPIFAEEFALISDLDLDARAISIVRNIEGVKAFEVKGATQITENGLIRLQQAIRSYFFNDQLLFPPPQAQPMTATESQIRYELMQRLLGPTLGRLQTDLLDLIVARTFNILARGNKLPEVPQVLAEEDVQMEVEYTGPLARAQRTDQALAVERWVGLVGAGAQALGPDVGADMIDVVDGEKVSRLTGRYLNVDPEMMRDQNETRARKEQREAMQQEAAQAQLAQEQGAGMQATAEGAQQLQAVEQ